MKPTNKLPPWLKPKVKPAQVKLAVAWYTEEEWRKVKEASVDSDRFEETYAEWVEMAEEALQDLMAAGLKAEKFPINSEELLSWCIVHGRINDAGARSEFVSVQSSRQSDGDA